MAETKKISCRVCGKLFTPCAYCQTHADVFRWRNFACSIECAEKYINDALDYRESLKKNPVVSNVETEAAKTNKTDIVEQGVTTKKKSKKKPSTEIVETKIENNETE